ncbi:hypothetical protein N7468_010183 [Penicillium chermesinum]|uniref:CCCH zinc finger and SMR domain protein n=1 Tax=Penicillium chermesinum TaxID=63820 RepID=A0A9W9TD37_9EURO|nr:uncharacterized protein N7468_010183 [Penicillium chermesinum]KAJ5217175.1 hypothetical protein N7468_010183 [Penicillium chermesinum]
MVSEELLEKGLEILQDQSLDEEEQVEKVEDLLRASTSLSGSSLENAVLDILWRHRNRTLPDSSPPLNDIPPASTSWVQSSRGAFSRPPLSSTASPFTSPRPSPRLALAQPIPHSPNLNAYEFSDQSQLSDFYGDFGSDSNVDWLVADDANSTTSSTGGLSASAALSATAAEFVPDMSPHDILRTVLGDKRSNEEIEAALEANGYDLGATIASLYQDAESETLAKQQDDARILVGKSMAMDPPRPLTPSGHGRSPVVCKFYLSHGQCLRADCRFSHDLTAHLCKYWMNGNCLAGDSCPFSHDPSSLVSNLSISDSRPASPSAGSLFQVDSASDAFPPLQASSSMEDQWANQYGRYPAHLSGPGGKGTPPGLFPGMARRNGSMTHLGRPNSRPNSRPTSRHQNRELNPTALSMDDPDAFPSLAAVSAKNTSKKHHGKRGGHNARDANTNKENPPSSLADVVRMSPSPAPSKGKSAKPSNDAKTAEHPWLETGSRANQQYIKYRTEAIRHGTVRNKFLQSAAQAWNRNDARAAKALSLRGQAENDAMRRCHREAARQLYEERNQHLSQAGLDESSEELYVDLHGLHPEEAIEYLEKILLKHANEGLRVVYAITGTGHHSKNGKDKIGKAVKAWLNEWRYLFREFSVPGERGG